MTWYRDQTVVDEVVRRYLAGDGPSEIARCFDLTRNQVVAKLNRLGHLRNKPSEPAAPRPRVRAARGSYGPRHFTATKADVVRRALAAGPGTVRTIVEATDLSSGDVSSICTSLLRQGHVERIPGPGRNATYRLLERESTCLRGSAYHDAEEAYIVGRKAGRRRPELATAMGLTASAAETFEGSYRQQTGPGGGIDNSCPKFAEHERHLRAVASLGTYPVMPRLADLRRPA